jgi:MurNAc alpha-1-phosphate uridylyltransferase
MISKKAFITAAGKGTRLRPYTDDRPKPMVEVKDRPIIDYVIDDLAEFGITSIGVNLWYKGDILRDHLLSYDVPDISLVEEQELLDTGGGIKNGLRAMEVLPVQNNDEAIFVTSAKAIWTNKAATALQRMKDNWDPDKMDMLMLLQPLSNIQFSAPIGDYSFSEDGSKSGKIERNKSQKGTHMWTSIRLMKPSLFNETPDGAFSFLDIMDKAEKTGRLYGLEHDAQWYHIRTPEDLDKANQLEDTALPQKRRIISEGGA